MIEISHRTAATLTLTADADFVFRDLPPLLSRLLIQAEAAIRRIDLAFQGDSVDYMTSEGDIALKARLGEDGRRRIVIACNTLVRGNREAGRQLCFEICRRLNATHSVSSIFWQPSRQTIAPDRFTWGALRDLPQRFAAPSTTFVPVQLGSALA